MTVFAALIYTSAFEIHTPFIYLQPETGTPFEHSLPIYSQTSFQNTDTEGTQLGVRIKAVESVWNLVSFGPSGLYVIERCPYYRGVRKERFDFSPL